MVRRRPSSRAYGHSSGESERNNGLCIGMRRPLQGELLGLAVLTKALALQAIASGPADFSFCTGTSTGGWGAMP